MKSEGGRTELKMLIYKNMVTTSENKVSQLHLKFGLEQVIQNFFTARMYYLSSSIFSS